MVWSEGDYFSNKVSTTRKSLTMQEKGRGHGFSSIKACKAKLPHHKQPLQVQFIKDLYFNKADRKK